MKIVFIINLLILVAANVFAGNEKGNGGTILDCNGRIVFADFEEINVHPSLINKITILEKETPVDDQIDEALKRIGEISPLVEERAQLVLKDFKKRVQFSGDDYEWMTSSLIDLPDFPLPKGCIPKTTIMYFDSGLIDMKLHLLKPLTNTHEAGLIVHEVVNRMIRATGEKSSAIPGRRITQFLFAQKPDREILKSLITRYMANVDGLVALYLPISSDENLAATYIKVESEVSDYGYGKFFLSPWNQMIFTPEYIGIVAFGMNRSFSNQQPGDFFVIKSVLVYEVLNYTLSLWRNNDPVPKKVRPKYQQMITSKTLIFSTEEEALRESLFFGTYTTRMNSFIGPQ